MAIIRARLQARQLRDFTTERTKHTQNLFVCFVFCVVITAMASLLTGCDAAVQPPPTVTPPTPARGGVISWRGSFADEVQGSGASGPCTVQLHIQITGTITCAGFMPDLSCMANGTAVYASEERQDEGEYHYQHTERGTITGRFAASLDLEPEGGQTHYTLNVVSIVPITAVTDDPHATPAHQEAQSTFTVTTTPDGLTDLATGIIRYDHSETLDKAEAACDELTTGTHTTTLTLTRDP